MYVDHHLQNPYELIEVMSTCEIASVASITNSDYSKIMFRIYVKFHPSIVRGLVANSQTRFCSRLRMGSIRVIACDCRVAPPADPQSDSWIVWLVCTNELLAILMNWTCSDVCRHSLQVEVGEKL
jgi:hypothetical protein